LFGVSVFDCIYLRCPCAHVEGNQRGTVYRFAKTKAVIYPLSNKVPN
jgi:hypothetical protein